MTPALKPRVSLTLLLIMAGMTTVFVFFLREQRLVFVGLGAVLGITLVVLWRAALYAAPPAIFQAQTHREFGQLLRSSWQGRAHVIVSNLGVLAIGVTAWRCAPGQFLEATALGCGLTAGLQFAMVFITGRRLARNAQV